jgi:hypothetical protein
MRLAVTLVLLAACTREPLIDVPGSDRRVVARVSVDPNPAVDVLFVIDNSGSMADEQEALASSILPSFYGIVEQAGASVHVAVVSTNVGAGGHLVTGCVADGDDGAFQSQPRAVCDPPDGQFIRDLLLADGTRAKNYTGTFGEVFSCIARLGSEGCGFEQPLESMRRALDGSNPQNQGFLRPDALLHVIVIADEDDCSAHDPTIFDLADDMETVLGPSGFRCFEFGADCDGDLSRDVMGPRTGCVAREDSPYLRAVSEYVTFLRGLKPPGWPILVSVIAAPSTPVVVGSNMDGPAIRSSCPPPALYQFEYNERTPGIRLGAFVDAFAPHSTFSTICRDMADGMLSAALLQRDQVVGRVCLRGPVASPETCHVTDLRDPGTWMERRIEWPPCEGPDDTDCWVHGVDSSCSHTDTGILVAVRRSSPAPAGSHVVVECLVE